MSALDQETQELIAEFKTQQARKEAERAEKKAGNVSKRELSRAREFRRPMTPWEVISYAKKWGISVEGGGGKHGMHLITPSGKECPVPMHGGGKTLAKGTQRSIVSFIHQYGMSRQ